MRSRPDGAALADDVAELLDVHRQHLPEARAEQVPGMLPDLGSRALKELLGGTVHRHISATQCWGGARASF